eukprot:TRINITY_DN48188_c0_g1_i1.p1 TRINITY_DN48188_c0_g1~~TRINITY_DN48188_c0_g1_i1.p1  ORF type:complete len:517 (-),score=80.50 TRINITY_DN48188_c0_g1_i1:28-1443(-)
MRPTSRPRAAAAKVGGRCASEGEIWPWQRCRRHRQLRRRMLLRPLGVLLAQAIGAAPTLAASSTVAAEPLRSVAFCVAGPVGRLPPEATIASTRRVVEHLGADAFAVLASRGDAELPALLRGWLTKFAVFSDGAGPGSLRVEYQASNPSNRTGDHIASYAEVGGNFLGPLVGNDGRNAFLVRDLWRCLSLMRSHEEERGAVYRYFAFSRIDAHWLAMPPSLQLLEQTDRRAIWIPDGQDWDGLNDRFALIPRVWASAYLGRWPRLLNGSLLPALRRATPEGPLDLKFNAGPEWLLRVTLHDAKVPVRRFQGVLALVCQQGSKRGRYGRCTRPFPPTGLSFKYSSEASEAHATLGRLQLEGWEWRAAHGPELSPGCFETTEQRDGCCQPPPGTPGASLNGDSNCWTDVYSYARCCAPRPGVWFLPSPTRARELLAAKAAPVCWTVVVAVSLCLDEKALRVLAKTTDESAALL